MQVEGPVTILVLIWLLISGSLVRSQRGPPNKSRGYGEIRNPFCIKKKTVIQIVIQEDKKTALERAVFCFGIHNNNSNAIS